MVSMGDVDAVGPWVVDARRRGGLGDVLEWIRTEAPGAAVLDALEEQLLFAARDAGGLEALVTEKAVGWSPELGERDDLLRLLLGLVSSHAGWEAIRNGVYGARAETFETMTAELSFAEHRDAGAGTLFALVEWYLQALEPQWVDRYGPLQMDTEARRVWYRTLTAFADHPVAPWITCEVLEGFTGSGITRAEARQVYADHLLDTHGEAVHLPLLHRALLRETHYDEVLWEWLGEQPVPRASRCYIERLSDAKKAVREAAIPALVAIGPRCLSQVRDLFPSADKKLQLTLALVLEHLPEPSSLPLIDSLLGEKQRKAFKEQLQRARMACSLVGPADARPVDAVLDSELASRKTGKTPAVIEAMKLPALVWRSGEPMSEGARAWFVRQLLSEGPLSGRGVPLLRERLEDAGCHALGELFWEAFLKGKEKSAVLKGLLFALRILATDEVIGALGSRLEALWRERSHTWSTYGVMVLESRGPRCAEALFWLEHWALHSKKTLQKGAIATLRRFMESTGLSWDELLESHLPDFAEEEHRIAAHDALVQRLTRAMVLGRAWSEEAWRALFEQPLAAPLLEGLVFGCEGRVFQVVEGQPRDVKGAPVPLSGAVHLLHPAKLSAPGLEAWRKQKLSEAHWQLERPVQEVSSRVFSFQTTITYRDVIESWMLSRGYTWRAGYGWERTDAEGITTVLEIEPDENDYKRLIGAHFERDGKVIPSEAASRKAFSEVILDTAELTKVIEAHEAYYEMWQE